MLEAAEAGRKLAKDEYEAQVPDLRAGLLEAQRGLRQAGVPVLVLVSGGDGAGKGETVNRLVEWLDPRGLETQAFGPRSDEERDRPPFWRFWRALPARGRIGIFFGSWYTEPIIERVQRKSDQAALEGALERIVRLERMLVDDGFLIVKFWLHLSKRGQRKRLEALESRGATRWRVSPLDWEHFELYDRFVKVCDRALTRTHSAAAPWRVVAAADDRLRELSVGRALLAAMQARLAAPAPKSSATKLQPLAALGAQSVLAQIDLERRVPESEYERELPLLQGRLNRLTRKARERKLPIVMVFEGSDAAGKGGAIRRLTACMDARTYRVVPIAAPSDEERAQHYLWRFWRHVPRAGQIAIFDRSWYGRVLVERVEGFARPAQWRRAYQEIVDFEDQLVEHGVLLLKFWLQVSPEEQLRRFEERKATAYKRHKLTDEDWRNREKWPAYAAALDELVARTSSAAAPWTLVAADDKRAARLQVLQTIRDGFESALQLHRARKRSK